MAEAWVVQERSMRNVCRSTFLLPPHAHILLFLDPSCKLTTPEDYDDVVCAEIPSKELEPELHELVMTFMVHGPCVGYDRIPV